MKLSPSNTIFLKVLLKRGLSTAAEVLRDSQRDHGYAGTSIASVANDMIDLRKKGLVESVSYGAKSKMMYYLTEEGKSVARS